MAKKKALVPKPKPLIMTKKIMLVFKDGFDGAIADPKTDSDPYKDKNVEIAFHRLLLASVTRNHDYILWPEKDVDNPILATAKLHGEVARESAELDGLKVLDMQTLLDTLDAVKASCPIVTIKGDVNILGLACDF